MRKYNPDFKRLDELTSEGYLRKVISPCGKLFLYNYTDKCTYDKKWNKHTLNARGTIYEVGTNKLVAKAFPKFFNFGELAVSKQRNLAKKTEFEVFEKMDGSLGIVYNYEGRWRINTRGSFTSDQACVANEILNHKYNMTNVPKDITILVEIIYPENRIIVDYGNQEKLVALGGYDLEHGGMDLINENFDHLQMYIRDTGIELAPSYSFSSIDELIETQSKLGKMEEGFVALFQDGERVKFKSAEYLKVARLLSNMTPLNFWRHMKDGIVQKDILEHIPEEFRKDADKMQKDLEDAYDRVHIEVLHDYAFALKCIGGYSADLNDTRKKLGLFIKENPNELKHKTAMFPKLVHNNVEEYIMRSIKPLGNKIMV